ncbi:MAG: hypothetical protein HW403_1264 [Dehalococcoidia bacterium]|nr:hypothetical protein [Dehalococcoidia bacterium]
MLESDSGVQSQARPRPRIFYGWYIVAACIAMNFYLSLTFFQGFQAFFLPILNEFGWSRTLMSGAFSVRQLESGILAPVIGLLVDRWGPRKVIFVSVLIGGAGMIFLGLIQSAWMFYLAFMVISVGMSGAGHGITWPVAVAYWFRRLRGRALGITFLGPVVSGPFIVSMVFLEEAVGWRVALVLLGVGLWIVGIPLALVARSRPEPYGYLPDGDSPSSSDATSSSALSGSLGTDPSGSGLTPTPVPEGSTARQAMRTPVFWVLVAIFCGHNLGINGIMVHQLPLFYAMGFSQREGAVIVGIIFVLSGIGRLGAGTLMDFLDKRLVLGGVILLQAVSYLMLLGDSLSWWQVILFSLMFGSAFGSTIPARPILIRGLYGSRAFGAISGLVQGLAFGMGLIGPIVMGAAFDLTGSYTSAILAFAALTLATVPLVLLLRFPSQEMAAPVAN